MSWKTRTPLAAPRAASALNVRVRRLAIGRINPAPYNPRRDLRPGDPEYARLERSIDEFGLVEPLVWNKRSGHLVGGHQRFKILLARGARAVDVSVVDLPPEREKALNIALNNIAGEWDRERLAGLLDELSRVPDFDLELTGFDAPDAQSLIAGILGGTEPAEETFDVGAELALNRPPVTKPGDLILLGRDPRLQHRLLCGDSTDAAAVRRLMDGERASLFATDPPYLVGYDGTNHPGINMGRKNKDWSATYGVTWDDASRNPDLYAKFLRVAVDHAIAPTAPFYIWHASKRQAMLESEMERVGAFVHVQIIWVKSRPVLTRTWYMWQHEPCLMGWLRGKRPRRRGGGRSGPASAPTNRCSPRSGASTVCPADRTGPTIRRPSPSSCSRSRSASTPGRARSATSRSPARARRSSRRSGSSGGAARWRSARGIAISSCGGSWRWRVNGRSSPRWPGATASRGAAHEALRQAGPAVEEGDGSPTPAPPPLLTPPPQPPDAETDRTVLDLIRAIQSGEIAGRTLSGGDRRRVVEHLWGDGYSTAETADILKISERTILRDRAAIRQANAARPDEGFVPETVGGLVRQADLTVARLRRVSRDKATPPDVRVDAELGCWSVTRELVQSLQTLGYLPSAPKQFQGELTHRVEEAPSYEDLQGELDRVERIVAAGGNVEVLDRVGRIKDTVIRLSLGEQVRALVRAEPGGRAES